MSGIDKVTLNIMKLIWLIQALVCQALIPLSQNNPELNMKLHNIVQSGWILFHDAEGLLTPQQMAMALRVGRFLLALIVFFLSMQIVGELEKWM